MIRPLFSLPARALRWGYDAVVGKAKRKPPTGLLRDEDSELNVSQRKQMLSAARDIHRNYVIAAWMVRKHLDFVTTFDFQAKTGDKSLDKKLEGIVRDWSRPEEFDVAGRHSLRRWLRLAEARAVLDGDVFPYRLASGRVQAIEGDRVRTPAGGLPTGMATTDLIHGVRVDHGGRLLDVCVCSRGKRSDLSPSAGGFVFERLIPAQHIYQHGYFDRFDQVRGISPLAPALNNLRDSYEGIDYALAKAKVSQIVGLALVRGNPNGIEDSPPEGTAADYKKMITMDGPMVMDLDPGDRAEWIESKTPSTEFQQFQTLVIQLALKALDIPFSFFNESFTNYSGSRGARLLYERSAQNRQADVVELLEWLTRWRLWFELERGTLTQSEFVAAKYEWVHAGLPWLDAVKETEANLRKVAGALTSRRRILKEQGLDWDDILDELAQEQEDLKARGLPTSTDPANALVQELVTNEA